MGMFDYIKYDTGAEAKSLVIKQQCEILEKLIQDNITAPAQKQKALNHLEICYMYVGKGIRDDQIVRNIVAGQKKPELQEERKDG